jgi:hypothetical protein
MKTWQVSMRHTCTAVPAEGRVLSSRAGCMCNTHALVSDAAPGCADALATAVLHMGAAADAACSPLPLSARRRPCSEPPHLPPPVLSCCCPVSCCYPQTCLPS